MSPPDELHHHRGGELSTHPVVVGNRVLRCEYRLARVMFDDGPICAKRQRGLRVSCPNEDGEVLGLPLDVVRGADGSLLSLVGYPEGRVYRRRQTGQ